MPGKQLGTQQRIESQAGHGRVIDELDPEGHVTGGVDIEQFRWVESGIKPAGHPEELLAHVVVDAVRRKQPGEVGETEDKRGQAGDQPAIKAAGDRSDAAVIEPEDLVALAAVIHERLVPLRQGFGNEANSRSTPSWDDFRGS